MGYILRSGPFLPGLPVSALEPVKNCVKRAGVQVATNLVHVCTPLVSSENSAKELLPVATV